nr:DNA repair protein RadC [Sphingomonas quercus]
MRCRQLLGGLLHPILAGNAAAVAARLIEEFGSLGQTLSASPERLVAIAGKPVAELLATMRASMLHSLRPERLEEPLLSNANALVAYLRMQLANLSHEEVHALYLDVRNRLIRDEMVARGTIGFAPCQPRDIIRRALELGASSIVLAHNHPSGDPKPSRQDIDTTRLLANAANALDIRLLDHMIIARSGVVSLHALGHV